MHSLALVLAVGALLGLVMGLLGGGGGILAVPLLVALGVGIREAATVSLVVVGLGALAGLVPHHLAKRVDWRMGLTFGALGVVGAVVGARLGISVNPSVVEAGFPVLLVLAGISMFRAARANYALTHARGTVSYEPTGDETSNVTVRSWPLTIALATGVGMVTGFFGVGGGFIVVPALVTAMRMPVRRATATGLVVIAINSAVALTVRHTVPPPWSLTLAMAAAAAVFTVVGALLSRRIPGWMLSAGFGALTVVVAIYSVVRLFIRGAN